MARTSGLKPSWLRRVLAALGGADSQILARARVDTAEMTGRGIAALIPAVFGGLAALISFRYAYRLPLGAAAAVGAGWAVVVLCFDLSLMTSAPDRRPVARAVTFGSRAVVSVLAAFTFASAIVMFMFARDIGVQVAMDQQTDLARYNSTVIVPAYAATIEADQNIITTDQGEINQADQAVAYWQQQVANAEFQVTCEAQGVSQFAGCGQGTGLTGQGPVYQVRLADLRKDQAALDPRPGSGHGHQGPPVTADRVRADGPVPGGTAGASRLRGGEGPVPARRRADRALAGPGRTRERLPGRPNRGMAPGGPDHRHRPGRRDRQDDLEDPLLQPRARSRAEEGRPSRHPGRRGRCRRDRAEPRRTRGTRPRITRQYWTLQVDVAFDALDAWKQVARQRIGAWVDEQTGGPTIAHVRRWQQLAAERRPGQAARARVPAGVPVNSHSLGGLMDLAQPHERMPVTMPKPLTRMAWLGTGLQAALGGALLLAHAAHAAVAGGWLVLVTLAAAMALAIYSRGFRRGPAWAHLAAFGTALLGLALPVVIVLVNI